MDRRRKHFLLRNESENGQTFKEYVQGFSGLVAYWPLDEESGTTIYNRAPATEGSLNGTLTLGAGGVLGIDGLQGKAIQLDTTATRILVSDNDLLSPLVNTGEMTLMGFMRPSAWDAGQWIFYKDGGSNFEYSVDASGVDDVQCRIRQKSDGAVLMTATNLNNIVNDQWQLFAAAINWNDDEGYFHVNDTVGSKATKSAGTIGNGTASLSLFRPGFGNGPTGLAQHFAILDRALTQAEVAEIAAVAGI